MPMWVAHSAPPKNPDKGPQSYFSHVENVRHGAKERASKMLSFAMGSVAEKADCLQSIVEFGAEYHDLGKLDDENQNPLKSGRGGRLGWDHIDAGVSHSLEKGNKAPAWLIRAHHSPGLPSADDEVFQERGFLRGNRNRGKKGNHLPPGFHDELVKRTETYLKEYLRRHSESGASGHDAMNLPDAHGLTLRLLLSCIVDADHTDTAGWDGVDELPNPPKVDWTTLSQQLDNYVSGLNTGKTDEKNRLRAEFYQIGVEFNLKSDRMFTCEAGVGLGKTTTVIRSLLNYAHKDNLRHLFVVAPYTNILRQSAKVLRKAFDETPTGQLISENHHRAEFSDVSSRQYSALWKAPITLTTAVQFFETLASNHPAHLRKLHELPGSVIFIDEAHTALPIAFWPQAWKWLKELADNWGCRIVLASGSMVRFWETMEIINPVEKLPELTPIGLKDENQILEAKRLDFVKLEKALDCAGIAARLADHLERKEGPILAIFNTVQSAAGIAREMAIRCDKFDPVESFKPMPLEDRKTLHLSTALSPVDRERVLIEIERRNEAQLANWILVATSCVEAGVDLDFQTGYRERCSVTALIQTSGRINRHNKRTNSILFDFKVIADGVLTIHPAFTTSSNIVNRLWDKIIAADCDPSSLVTLAMKMEISAVGGISQAIIKNERAFDYPAVAEEFRIVQSDTRTIIVSKTISERLARRERVSTNEILKNSVQLWADKVDRLGLPIFPQSDLYQWNGSYDADFLGVMKGILSLSKLKVDNCIIVSNTQ